MKQLVSVKRKLLSATDADNTVLQACKDAAGLAAKQLDAELPLKERIEAVVLCYTDVYNNNPNVKALFKDALTLLACAQTPISIEKKDGELHTVAEKALEFNKHDMREAAKQVREANGMARKAGGGRKPRQPEAKAQVTPAKLSDFAKVDAVLDLFDKPDWRKDFAGALAERHGKARAAKLLTDVINSLK